MLLCVSPRSQTGMDGGIDLLLPALPGDAVLASDGISPFHDRIRFTEITCFTDVPRIYTYATTSDSAVAQLSHRLQNVV